MTFSVIVPVYNIARYVKECAESILNQTFSDYELILVDDGSTDGSSRICDQIAGESSRVKVIHKENGGLSDARNCGIKAAQGQYILFVDGDDYIGKESLENIHRVIKSCSTPDIVCLEAFKFYDGYDAKIPMQDGINERINGLRGKELHEYLAKLPKYPASACTKAIRRQLFAENDLYFVKGLLSEDLEWCLRLFLAAESFAYCPYSHYFYRQNRPGSIANTSSAKKTLDILNTTEKWVSYAENISEHDQKMLIYSYMEYVFRFLILGYRDICSEERKQYKMRVHHLQQVLGTRQDKPSKCIKCAYCIFGIDAAEIMLKVYLNLRKKNALKNMKNL